jgi:hypothetical protein
MYTVYIRYNTIFENVIYGSGQPYIYTVYVRYVWQGIYQKYNHIQQGWVIRTFETSHTD